MAQIEDLQKLDPAPLDYTNFSPTFKRWLSDVVDILNIVIQRFNDLVAVEGIDIGGGGAGPIVVPVIGITPLSDIAVRLISSTNPVLITTVVPGMNQFSISFSGDPGASAIIKYLAFTGIT